MPPPRRPGRLSPVGLFGLGCLILILIVAFPHRAAAQGNGRASVADAPASLVDGLVDNALKAELRAPPPVRRSSGPAMGLIVVGVLSLVVVVGVAVKRKGARRHRSSVPGSAPRVATGVPASVPPPKSAEDAMIKFPPFQPPPPSLTFAALPPPVADRPQEDGGPRPPDPPTGPVSERGGSGVDILIGR